MTDGVRYAVAELPLAILPPHGRVHEDGAPWLAEHEGLGEPPFRPEHVHDTELPADGNAVLLGVPVPLAH